MGGWAVRCRKALGAGQSEARGTGRPLCTLCAGGSQPSGNLLVIQPQPHMKLNSLSARTINKEKPHSADHPGLLNRYCTALNSTPQMSPRPVFTHLDIRALTTVHTVRGLLISSCVIIWYVVETFPCFIHRTYTKKYSHFFHNSHYYSAVRGTAVYSLSDRQQQCSPETTLVSFYSYYCILPFNTGWNLKGEYNYP